MQQEYWLHKDWQWSVWQSGGQYFLLVVWPEDCYMLNQMPETAPSNWITNNFSICVLTACLQMHRAKIFKTKILKKQITTTPFSSL